MVAPPFVFVEGQPVEDLAQRINLELKKQPHAAVLSGYSATEDRSMTVALAQHIATLSPVKANQPEAKRGKVSFTRVRINPSRAVKEAGSTSYSRTNQPLSLHTDSTYKASPHELVAFQMVRSDSSGGDTTLMSVEAVIENLDADILSLLQKPIFPFGKGDFSILWNTGTGPRIRYYRNQIDNAVRRGARVSQEAMTAIDALDEVLERSELGLQFKLQAGDILFLDNTRVLHGRTGFSEASERLMYRIRVEAGCLG